MTDELLLQLKHEARTHKLCGAMGLGKLFESAHKRIAELEKELTETQNVIIAHQVADETGCVDGEGWVKNWAEIEEKTINILEAHNLGQIAKGFEWVLACRELNLSEGEVYTLMDKCNQLRKQEKALKEQVK